MKTLEFVKTYHLLIVDDHHIFRIGFISALKGMHDNCIFKIDEAANAEDAIIKANNNDYDLILMDYRLPVMNGDKCTAQILKDKPHAKILGMSGHDECEYLQRMMDAGAIGYVSKSMGKEQFIEIIIKAINGGEYFDPELLKKIVKQKSQKKIIEEEKPKLTLREQEILKLVTEEYSNKEIADKLCLSEKTVDIHRHSILKKLKAKNVAGVIMKAIQHKLIQANIFISSLDYFQFI